MLIIPKHVFQKNIFTGNRVKICINPAILNNKRKRSLIEKHIQIEYKTLKVHSLIEKNNIITSIYKPHIMEYLLYSPVHGKIVNINYDLLHDLDIIFTKTYQIRDILNKLCVAEIEIEDTTKHFTGYH